MAEQETRQFTVHTNILFSIIKSQAGSLAKAMLEAAMNALDAGASRFNVEITNERFVVSDDGKGFRTKEEIVNWFGQFGTPHEEGDAIYGRFRMGRGQMMSFARTVWRTGEFEMGVDIRDKGLDYTLKQKLRPKKGCHVTGTLYKPMNEEELREVLRDFEMQVKYFQVPVRLNGKVISKKPADLTWDLETDDAYIKVTRGDSEKLEVHNLGVFVKAFASYSFGCGGVVVSKKPLQVNFARNDILQYECKVWERISKFLKQANIGKVTRKGSLNKDERAFLAQQFTYGYLKDADIEARHLKIITDVTGRHHSIDDLLSARNISVATKKQARAGAQLHRERAAFVLSEETIRRFECSNLESFLRTLRSYAGVDAEALPQALDFAKLAENHSEDFTTLNLGALDTSERIAFEVINLFHQRFFDWYGLAERTSGIRELRVGESNVASGWTNGLDYVTLHRKVLRSMVKRGGPAIFEMLALMVHEYVHDSADIESHEHDFVFYSKFHDAMCHGAGKLFTLAQDMEKALSKMLVKANCVPQKASACAPKEASSIRKMSLGEARALTLKARQMELAM